MRTLKGIGALALLLALLVGIPAALIVLAGNPVPSLDALQQALTGIDFGGRVLMGTILPLIGWVAWASFAVSVVVELIAQAREVRAPRLKGLGAQQALAGALVAAVLAIGGGSPALAQQAPQLEPETAGAQASSQQVDETYVVRHGDTLYGIATEHLGDGQRWTELAEQLEQTPQADGQTLQDPNLIYEGWELSLPPSGAGSTAVAPDAAASFAEQAPAASAAGSADAEAGAAETAPAAPEQQSAEQEPAPEVTTERSTSAAAEVAPGRQGSAEDAQQDRPTDQHSSSLPGVAFTEPAPAPVQEQTEAGAAVAADEDGIDWRTAGGIGSTLAAGVLGLIGARRLAQRRRRKPGQQVPLPTGEDAQVEAQLMAVADQPAVDELDLVLRAVSVWAAREQVTLPEMFCVRVTDEQIALYLATPADAALPAPFVQEDEEGTVWTIGSGLIEGLEYMPEAPYPALVTVGKDDTGAQMLLDLEYLATLGLEGPEQLVAESLDAMAVELATSVWGEQLTVTLVGVAPGLAAATGNGRVRQVDDLDELLRMLHGRAEDVRAALDDAGMGSVHEAKGAGLEQDWAPEIVLLGVDPTDEQADQLRELTRAIPRLGVAAVTTQNPLSAQWRLELVDQDNADLEPAGLHLTPQRITREEAQQIITVLTTALADPVDTDAAQTQTVDLAAILGRPATHLTLVPDHDGDADAEVQAELEEQTETLEQVPVAAPEQPGDEGHHEPGHVEAEPGEPEFEEAAAETVPVEQGQEAEEDETDAAAADEAVEITMGPAQPIQPVPAPSLEPDDADEEELLPAAAEHQPETGPEDAHAPAVQDDHDLTLEAEQTPEAAQATATEPVEEPEAARESAAATVTRLAPADEEAELDQQASALLDEMSPEAPLVALLGEMRVFGAQGEEPVSRSTSEVSAPRLERCVALAAFLALRPGASATAYHAAFWPNADPTGKTASSSRNKLAGETRKMLGQDEDGALFFPRSTSGTYRLDERVTTDWQIFQALAGEDPTTTSTPALVAAMRLVRGAPFQHARSRNIAWADELHLEMVETICDAAHELVHRSLAAGHHGHAQLAARVGRTVDPANEAAWRDAITAEAAAGNREEVARLVEQLYSWLEAFEEGLEPEPETTELIEQLREHGYRVVA